MPEGDTIATSAATLAGVLVGRAVTGFRSSVPGIEGRARALGVAGSRIERVEARGKHLLIHFSPDLGKSGSCVPEHSAGFGRSATDAGSPLPGGAVLRTHMRMTGSWHLYRVGTRWRKSASFARVIVEAGEVLAVCFSAPEVELLEAGQVASHEGLQRLGPDLLDPAFDATEALARLRAASDLDIADALLDQSIMAGIGNVYKSEVLFLERVNPFVKVGSLPDEVPGRLIATARRELRRNAGTGQRRTTTSGQQSPLWVYNRADRPCARCGAVIRRAVQGPHARSTYWCPGCQP